MTKQLFSFLLVLLPVTMVAQVKAYAIYKDGVMTFRCDDKMPENKYCWEVVTEDGGNDNSTPGWHYMTSVIQGVVKVVFDASFANARPRTCKQWFENMENLTAMVGLDQLDTRECTNMEAMFKGCTSLTSIDVGGLSTNNVKSMCQMFRGCTKLEHILIYGINTKNVANMDKMFSECDKLTSLNLGSFDTEIVQEMTMMFYKCKELQYIFISNTWNTDNVTMSGKMFEGCEKLVGQDGSRVGDVVDKTYAHSGIGGYMRSTIPVESSIDIANRNVSNSIQSYSLDGKRLSTPQRGLNIVRMNDGTTKKVVKK